MLYVEADNTIRLTRGDTAYLEIPIVNDITEEEYVISPDDTLTFSVKRSVKDKNVCFSKTIRGANTIHINPDDTRQLEFGKYKYDVQLTTAAGDVYTVIEPTCFEVLSEVTT